MDGLSGDITEHRLEPVVGRQEGVAIRGFRIGPEAILHRHLGVVEDYPPGYTAEIFKCLD